MPSYASDRRSVLKIFGAIGATCAYPFASDELFAQETAAHHHPTAPPPQADLQPRFFNKADYETISQIANLIIPPTDTPGAIAAGVPGYIDLVISRNTDQQLVVADGLRWLDGEADRIAGTKFMGLKEEQQLSILEPLCEAADRPDSQPRGRNVQFFALIKSLTADGYYTSRVGLVEELRYRGNTALPEFPKCSDQGKA